MEVGGIHARGSTIIASGCQFRYCCRFCYFKTQSWSEFHDHFRCCHLQDSVEKGICPYCDFVIDDDSVTPDDINITVCDHLLKVHNEIVPFPLRIHKDYRCSVCGGVFWLKDDLDEHLRMVHCHPITMVGNKGRKNTTSIEAKLEKGIKKPLSKSEFSETEQARGSKEQVDYKCSFCDGIFWLKKNLDEHIRKNHGSLNKACKKVTPGKLEFRNLENFSGTATHLQFMSTESNEQCQGKRKDEKVKCFICMRSFHSKEDLCSHCESMECHMKKIFGEGQCFYCPFRFKGKRYYSRHAYHGKLGFFNHCRKNHLGFPLPGNNKLFKCSVCTSSYVKEYNLRRHVMKSHGSSEVIDVTQVERKNWTFISHSEFRCNICLTICKSFRGLGIHLERRHKVYMFDSNRCHICGYEYSGKYTRNSVKRDRLLGHFNTVHAMYDLNPHKIRPMHQCQICNKSYVLKRDLEIHLKLRHLQQ